MNLPVSPPVEPMLARLAPSIPPGMHYEPKWDGFRCIIFRDGDEVVFGSRTGRPLERYFPELVDGARRELPARCVIDGEIVVLTDGRVDFGTLQQRIHPAASRIRALADASPAVVVVFDLLAVADTAMLTRTFHERRARLVELLAGSGFPFLLTPATDDHARAEYWFAALEGAGLDGVVAKPFDLRYQPGKRVMVKIKHERTADCVVAGMRPYRGGSGVGSLLLGLYDDAGVLQYVGVCGAFAASSRTALATELSPLVTEITDHPWGAGRGRVPGTPNRWNAGENLDWVPLRPERVCEVAYDFLDGARFRHTAQFRRWRPDRTPESCRFDQFEVPEPIDLVAALDLPPADRCRPRPHPARP